MSESMIGFLKRWGFGFAEFGFGLVLPLVWPVSHPPVGFNRDGSTRLHSAFSINYSIEYLRIISSIEADRRYFA